MWFVKTPGLKVVAPATAYDAKGLIKSAIRDNDPVIFFEHKALYRRIKEELPPEEYTVPIGKARVARQGRDLSIITYGAMVWVALEAAETLAQEGASRWKWWICAPCCRSTATPSARASRRLPRCCCCTKTHAPPAVAGELAISIAESVFEHLDAPIGPRHRARYAGALQSAARRSLPPQRRKSNRKIPLVTQLLSLVGRDGILRGECHSAQPGKARR